MTEILSQTASMKDQDNIVFHRGPNDLRVLLWVTAVGDSVTVIMDEWTVGGAQTESYIVNGGNTKLFALELGDGRGLSIHPTAGSTAIYRAALADS